MDGSADLLALILQNTFQIMYDKKKKYSPPDIAANIINVNYNVLS